MCIDLKPLNQRIYPQKYPFSIIDDQLDSLYGKKYFTKLDLKDEFHQIAIHPDCIKYFSFATPSEQYEYLKLPFGFSDASNINELIMFALIINYVPLLSFS